MTSVSKRIGFERIYFGIENAPGPFRLVSEEVRSYEQHGNRLIVEFTVVPIHSGEKLLSHQRMFRVPFEVALRGATTTLGHGINEPRNVRFLGRFLIPAELQPHFIDPTKVASELNAWQWEAVFNPRNRKGMVFRLDEPLPESWTM